METKVNEANWSEHLEEHDQDTGPLTSSVREHLSLEGQSAMRRLRELAPQFKPTVHRVEEE